MRVVGTEANGSKGKPGESRGVRGREGEKLIYIPGTLTIGALKKNMSPRVT